MKMSPKKSRLLIIASVLCALSFASSLFAGALSVSMTPSSNQIVLKDESVSFDCSPSGGCSPYAFSWSAPNATLGTPTSQSSVATFGADAEGKENTVTITVTDNVGATASANIKVRVPKVDMTRPDDKANRRYFHYAFGNQSPGVCEVTCKVAITPDTQDIRNQLQNNVQWSIDSIQDSTLSWQNGGTGPGKGVYFGGEWEEKAIYTTLPANNNDFGVKNVTVTLSGMNYSQQGKAAIFFGTTEKNHPGAGSGTTPNWYFYWSQTSADHASHSYDESIVSPIFGQTVFESGHWVAKIGRDDYQATSRFGGVDGIDHFSNTTRHENQHVVDGTAWWPNGYVSTSDADGDWIPDNLEAGLGYNPALQDTDGDGDRDSEDHAYDNQPSWTKGTANTTDWSLPGHQSQLTYTEY